MSRHHSLEHHRHRHVYLGEDHARNERRTWAVVGLTLAMMALEIAAGLAYGSMALLADGVHMATHAGALAISGFAYAYARRHAEDPRYSFGTGKVGDLAGFSSALILALFALGIAGQSLARLFDPRPIAYGEAISIAVLGLLVNLISAWLLQGSGHGHDHGHHGHAHDHDHDYDHDHDHAPGHTDAHHSPHVPGQAQDPGHEDHNLRSAYLHVLADALTSVMAIVALVAAWQLGWNWLDPVTGLVGALVIARWSYSLLRDTGRVLLDASADPALEARIRDLLQTGGTRIADLHLWRVGPGRYAAIIALVTPQPAPAGEYKQRLAVVPELAHVTVEVQACADCGP